MKKIVLMPFLMIIAVLVMAAGGSAGAFPPGAFSAADDKAVSRPLLVPVFEGGGGPDADGVDINTPPIGDCGAPDSNGRYKVSTCLPDVNNQLRKMAENYVVALKKMAAQMTGVMMQQMFIIGTFFDADEQLDMQRDIQLLTLRAQRDYHPSEQLCAYGSGIRSLAHTEERGRMNQLSLNEILVNQYGGRKGTVTAPGYNNDILDRLDQFKKTYCDPDDNNGMLWELCHGQSKSAASKTFTPEQQARFNKDIHYGLTISEPKTLDIDFTDAEKTDTEEDIVALARNLYWNTALDPLSIKQFDKQAYMAARSLMARASLAHNSFTTLAGMKSRAPLQDDPANEVRTGGAHLKAVLRDFGMSPAQIEEMYGKNPSYYAQMDILSKTIYQNPDFYTNLYDKPANIDRINTAMAAIRLMQLRDRYDSQQRRELLLAALLEDGLFAEEGRVYSAIQQIVAARR